MSRIRKLLLSLVIAASAASLPPAIEALPEQCSGGAPYCSAVSGCASYCQQLGWPYGLCNLQTHCCHCSD